MRRQWRGLLAAQAHLNRPIRNFVAFINGENLLRNPKDVQFTLRRFADIVAHVEL